MRRFLHKALLVTALTGVVASGVPTSAGAAPVPSASSSPAQGTPAESNAAVATPASAAAALAGIRGAFPASEWVRAEMVARCESGLRSVTSKPNGNGTRDHGLFQLNDGGTLQGLLGRAGADPSNIALALDPAWNAKAAAELWKSRGWQPWTCAAKLGIVAGLWSYEPGPNGGSAAFDPAKAEAVDMASSLAARSAQASAELVATTRAELSSLEGKEKELAVALGSQKSLLEDATSAATAGRERLSAAEADLSKARAEAASARETSVRLEAELVTAQAALDAARAALGAQARANYITGGAAAAAHSLATLTVMTSADAGDVLQARNVASTVLERRAALTQEVKTEAKEVERLSVAALDSSQKADLAEAAASSARHAISTEQALLDVNEAQAQVSAQRVEELLVQASAQTGEVRARLDLVVGGLEVAGVDAPKPLLASAS